MPFVQEKLCKMNQLISRWLQFHALASLTMLYLIEGDYFTMSVGWALSNCPGSFHIPLQQLTFFFFYLIFI